MAIELGLAAFGGVLIGGSQVTAATSQSKGVSLARDHNGKATGFFATENKWRADDRDHPCLVALLGGRSGRHYVQQDAGRYAIIGGALSDSCCLWRQPVDPGVSSACGWWRTLLIRASLGERWRGGDPRRRDCSGWRRCLAAIFAAPSKEVFRGGRRPKAIRRAPTSFKKRLRAAPTASRQGRKRQSTRSTAYEDPTFARWFVNHGPNDLFELGVETGWGVARFLLVARGRVAAICGRRSTIICARRVHRQWRHPGAQWSISRPTTAIAAVFAMSVALMAGPRRRVRGEHAERHSEHGARHLAID